MTNIICDCNGKSYGHWYVGKKCMDCKSIIDINRRRIINNNMEAS